MSSHRFEIRQQADGGLTLRGYAATFERPYDMGWYVETIATGAFKRSLSNSPDGPDVSLLVNHGQAGSGLPLARTTAGTLHLSEDDHGLLVNADLDAIDPEVQSLHRKMQRGDLDGQMSFAFRVAAQSWNDERTHRRVLVAELNKGDVSIVNYGANDQTSSTIRSADGGVPLEVRQRRAEAIGQRFARSPGLLRADEGHSRWSDDLPAPISASRAPANSATSISARSRRSLPVGFDLRTIRDRERVMFIRYGINRPVRKPTGRTAEERLRIEALRNA